MDGSMRSGMTTETLRTTLDSQLFYSYSTDAGVTWSTNVPVSNAFNPQEGWPNQNKIGDYITLVSDDTGGNVAYAATFNFNPNRGQHEQDVYYVRVFPGGQGPTPTPTPTVSPTATPTIAHATPNADCNTDRYCNSYGYRQQPQLLRGQHRRREVVPTPDEDVQLPDRDRRIPGD